MPAVAAAVASGAVARVPLRRAHDSRPGATAPAPRVGSHVSRAGASSRRPGARRVAAAAAAPGRGDPRNPAAGAISDANATRGGERVSWGALFANEDAAEFVEVDVSDVREEAPASRAASEAVATAAALETAVAGPAGASSTAPERGGFYVRQSRHARGCACSTCAALRTLVDLAPDAESPDLNASPRPDDADPVIIAHDGGFVVGKQQQKHHVRGCRCPNCNNMRFRRDRGAASCVTIDRALLVELVGPENCFQKVLDERSELERRAKIGAANKGKSAWNKGKHHSPETIAKIKAGTARAMRNPEVKRRMREAAAKTFHSETTKMKIRRTVRDSAHKKMGARNAELSSALGIRRGKVGTATIGAYARRVSAVQTVSFGVWSKLAMDRDADRKKRELKEFKRVAKEERRRAAREEKLKAQAATGRKPRSTRGVPKTEAHKKAISEALKAKWEDPAYLHSQKTANRTRKKSTAATGSSSARTKGARERREADAKAARTLRAMSAAEKKRARLVSEMKDMYSKASVAVKALEARKLAGLEVDELMLQKALGAVAETRKVLASLEATEARDASREKKNKAAAGEGGEPGSRARRNAREGEEGEERTDGGGRGRGGRDDDGGIDGV